ncbi:MAG: transcription antitermination factor NusB [Alphaproteobacteria bacterium]|uniref:Transcription antitermination protein NusB n=1 Tax=Candidatus Nitrobium versatile TaxID=2884831 RepID=A0A953JEH9_9BACT|nr:transcription antitermination factor NusB [Candidatus Nitrobium versatile]
MKRRQAREYALQFLYRLDFIDIPEGGTARSGLASSLQRDLDGFWKEREDSDPEVRAFTEDLVLGTIRNLETLDSLIQKVTEKWKLSRMASIDRNILRFATYEILFRRDIPHAVSINEAIEIAKKYSTAESASFINGILDRIAREHGGKGSEEPPA